MTINDYSNEPDYYDQGFEKDGVVSVWVGLTDGVDDDEEIDVLQDLCGVGYYDIDNQESNCLDFQSVTLKKLIEEMSYSDSFIFEVITQAENMGISKAKWVVLQYDFEYDPNLIKRPIKNDPIYIGSFHYEED